MLGIDAERHPDLQVAAAAVQRGDLTAARPLILARLRAESGDPAALLLASYIPTDEDKRIDYALRALQVDPTYAKAQARLGELTAQQKPVAPTDKRPVRGLILLSLLSVILAITTFVFGALYLRERQTVQAVVAVAPTFAIAPTVVVPSPVATRAPTTTPLPTQTPTSSTLWQYSDARSALDDARTQTLRLPASDTGSRKLSAALVLRCRAKKLQVFFYADTPLSYSTTTFQAPLAYRFDDAPVQTISGTIGEEHKALFMGTGEQVQFLKDMKTHTALVFAALPDSGARIEATFTLTRFEEAYLPLDAECPLTQLAGTATALAKPRSGTPAGYSGAFDAFVSACLARTRPDNAAACEVFAKTQLQNGSQRTQDDAFLCSLDYYTALVQTSDLTAKCLEAKGYKTAP